MAVRITIGIAEEDLPKFIKAYEDGKFAHLGVTDLTFPPEMPIKPSWLETESTKRRDRRNSKNEGPEP